MSVGLWVGCCLILSMSLYVNAGTTQNLQEIFQGRCWEYQRVINPQPFTLDREKDCIVLWELFSDAFMYKDACNVSIDAYKAFAEEAVHDLPKDKTLLWSGVWATVHDYNDVIPDFTVVVDTLIGYMAGGVVWCGQVEEPGFNSEECPAWGACERAADLSYWRAVSQIFAARAEGTVRVMLNGSSGHAYRNNSVFAEYELPYLNPDQVTQFEALIVHDYGKPVRESCSNGSLAQLKSAVEEMKIPYICTDDPVDIRYLMCVDDIDAYECRMISEILGHISASERTTPLFKLFPVLLVLSAIELTRIISEPD